MKRFVFAMLMVSMLGSAYAWIHPGDPESIRTLVIDAPGLNADEIFTAIHEWLIAKVSGPKNAIQIADKDSMTIIAKLYTEDAMRIFITAYPISFTWKFEIKDEKFRITMADIRLTKSVSQKMNQDHYNQIWTWEDGQLSDLSTRLVKKEDSDW